MYTKTVTYTDYNGTKRTEDFMFNLTQAELIQMETSRYGGLERRIRKITDSPDDLAIMEQFKDILRKSYGVKSDDGRRFMKSDELFEDFAQTEAYSIIFMELMTNSDAAIEFVNKVMPQEVADKVAEIRKISEETNTPIEEVAARPEFAAVDNPA